MGLEPTTSSVTGWRTNQLYYRATTIFLEAPPRFELGVKALQASALPLGYGAKKMERKTRFELATFALARRRSTTEPLPHIS